MDLLLKLITLPYFYFHDHSYIYVSNCPTRIGTDDGGRSSAGKVRKLCGKVFELERILCKFGAPSRRTNFANKLWMAGNWLRAHMTARSCDI